MAERLVDGLGLNSPQEYDSIFQQRADKGVDPSDLRRWKRLLKYYKGGPLIDLGTLDSEVPILARNYDPTAEVWGIDTARECILKMQDRYPEIHYALEDVYETHFPSNYFSYAVAGEIIEHLDDPSSFFKEAVRILKPGGVLAVSTPLEEAKEPGAVDLHRHLWSFSSNDLKDMLSPYGSVRIRYLRSQWFPYYRYQWPTLIVFCTKHV